jgi:hypothetical protein
MGYIPERRKNYKHDRKMLLCNLGILKRYQKSASGKCPSIFGRGEKSEL